MKLLQTNKSKRTVETNPGCVGPACLNVALGVAWIMDFVSDQTAIE